MTEHIKLDSIFKLTGINTDVLNKLGITEEFLEQLIIQKYYLNLDDILEIASIYANFEHGWITKMLNKLNIISTLEMKFKKIITISKRILSEKNINNITVWYNIFTSNEISIIEKHKLFNELLIQMTSNND